jgi:methylenetetrahydrofolate--tRNA-(uracil-5-)-methyltransferase
MAAKVLGRELPNFPRETAIGALAYYISDETISQFQPMNINFGIMPSLGYRVKGKANKNLALAQRSLEIIEQMESGV